MKPSQIQELIDASANLVKTVKSIHWKRSDSHTIATSLREAEKALQEIGSAQENDLLDELSVKRYGCTFQKLPQDQQKLILEVVNNK